MSHRIGKHRTVVVAIVWLSIWSAPIPLLRPEHYWLFVALMVLKGSAVGALTFLPTSMAADVVERRNISPRCRLFDRTRW